jgi:hypothetical protein
MRRDRGGMSGEGKPKIATPSLRAQRSNPFFLYAALWIASLRSQ